MNRHESLGHLHCDGTWGREVEYILGHWVVACLHLIYQYIGDDVYLHLIIYVDNCQHDFFFLKAKIKIDTYLSIHKQLQNTLRLNAIAIVSMDPSSASIGTLRVSSL